MSEKSWFYNSEGGDRPYNAEDIGAFLAPFFSGGVFAGTGTNLQVTASGSGMTVTIQPGIALLKSSDGKMHMYKVDAPITLPITTADGASNRIDRIAIRHETANRYSKAQVKLGVYATNPTAPDVQQDTDYWELALADVIVNAGTAAITQSMVTDQRLNTAVCGVVAATVQQLDTSTYFAQLQSYFNEQKASMTAQEQAWTQSFITWFNSIKGSLSGDVAGNLLIKINDNASAISSNATYQAPSYGSTATAIILAYAPLTNGYATNFIASAANSAAATTVNGKPLYKPNTTTAPNLIAGKPYTAIYNADGGCFFVKASGEGSASASDVRKGKSFTNDNDTGIIGALDLDNLTASNVRKDVTIGGVTGNSLKYGIGDVIRNASLSQSSVGGDEIWNKIDITSASAVAVDASENVYVGYNSGNFRKLDSSGNQIWAKTGIGNFYGSGSVALDPSGNVYAATTTGVYKYDSNGNLKWSKTDVANAYSVAVDTSGNVHVAYSNSAGTTTVRKLDSNGNQIWAKSDYGNAWGIAVDTSGFVYVAYYNTGARKLDSSGTQIWITSSNMSGAAGIAVDASGNVYVANYSNNGLRKLSSSSTELWAKTDVANAYSVAVDTSGNVHVAYMNNNGKTIRKLDSSGNELWSKADVINCKGITVSTIGYTYVCHSAGIRKLDGQAKYTIAS